MFFNKKHSTSQVGLIEDYSSVASESIQKLQTAINFAGVNKELRVIGVTSAEQSEGKSTLIGNLANIYALKGAKVIVVNLDLRRPSIHKLYHLENKVGIVEYITGETTLDKIINHLPSGVDLINSGSKTPFPTKILESDKMPALIEKLKEKYDYVLVDTTPILVVTDAMIVSKYVDGFLFVCAQHLSKKKDVAYGVKMLLESGANVIGTVITRATDLSEIGSNSSYYYYYYDEDSSTHKHRHHHR